LKIIFGLGNPGKKYKNNRHNIGYMVIERIAEDVRFKRSIKLKGYLGEKEIAGEKILLVKPTTFMNNSGICVKKIIDYYQIHLKDFLVIYDDVDLPLGKIRFRRKGSSGGHKGIKSIIEILGSEEINRLRIGIGKKRDEDLAEYVLSDFSPQEKEILKKVISDAVSASLDWVKFGADYVMQNYN
jgi:PTH1 family peptidyl-tRNA hydrolase